MSGAEEIAPGAALQRPRRTAPAAPRRRARLEQIVALKFIGLSLKRIKAMLDRDTAALAAALRLQLTVLEEKRRLLDQAIQAIRAAEKSCAGGGRPAAAILKNIIEVIEMQNDSSSSEKYYSPVLAETSKAWLALFAEIEAALDLDPASETAQALGARWKKLVGGFTGGNPEIGKGLNKMYADRPNWPASARETMAPFGNPKVWEFMRRVLQCASIG